MWVPGRGLEPPRPCGLQILSLARLPISPPGRGAAKGRAAPESVLLATIPDRKRSRATAETLAEQVRRLVRKRKLKWYDSSRRFQIHR